MLGFILLIMLVLLIAAFGMWFAQRMAVRVGRQAPSEGPRFEEPVEGEGAVRRHPSPDGRFDLQTTVIAMTMGRGIEQPALVEIARGRRLFAAEGNWSADEIRWTADSRTVTMRLRHHPGAVPEVTVSLDLLAGEARMNSRAGVERMTFAEAERWLDRYPALFGV